MYCLFEKLRQAIENQRLCVGRLGVIAVFQLAATIHPSPTSRTLSVLRVLGHFSGSFYIEARKYGHGHMGEAWITCKGAHEAGWMN
jgi:hypothetical protein